MSAIWTCAAFVNVCGRLLLATMSLAICFICEYAIGSMTLVLVVFIAIALFGCKSYEDYKNERVESAIKHFERAQYTDLPTDKVLSLKECIELAIENNVDLKVYSLEEKVSHEMRTSEMLGMLPDLTVSDSYVHRDNVAASSSKQVHGTQGPGNYTYSTSQDKTDGGTVLPDRIHSGADSGKSNGVSLRICTLENLGGPYEREEASENNR